VNRNEGRKKKPGFDLYAQYNREGSWKEEITLESNTNTHKVIQ